MDPSPYKLTLPTDSAERKEVPLDSGVLSYFPAALAGVARISKQGNDKHNPGQPLHHARGKSTDHSDCILRHLVDLNDLLAAKARALSPLTPAGVEAILAEASCLAWRALALSQELHEQLAGAPLAPAARVDSGPIVKAIDEDGWIAHDGGGQPALGDTRVVARFISGEKSGPVHAGSLYWGNDIGDASIAAYKVLE